MTTIKQFLDDSYRLINPGNPTQPLHGNDLSFGLRRLNDLLTSYAADGLMMTIASTQTVALTVGQEFVTAGPPPPVTIPPTPPLYNINVGRMANWESAWLNLMGVDYPLVFKTQDQWHSSFKYQPLSGLPRFIIPFPDVQSVSFRLYPSPSQFFQFFIRGKFQLPNYLSTDDTMLTLPGYYNRYFLFAVAKDLALFKGRTEAWTDKLEDELIKASKIIQANSEVDLAIVGDEESLLNGSWRVRAGV